MSAALQKRLTVLEQKRAERRKRESGGGTADYQAWLQDSHEPIADCVIAPAGDAKQDAAQLVVLSIPQGRFIDAHADRQSIPFWCRGPVTSEPERHPHYGIEGVHIEGEYLLLARGPNLVPLRSPLTSLEIERGATNGKKRRFGGNVVDLNGTDRIRALEKEVLDGDASDLRAGHGAGSVDGELVGLDIAPLESEAELNALEEQKARVQREIQAMMAGGSEVTIDMAKVPEGKTINDPAVFAKSVTITALVDGNGSITTNDAGEAVNEDGEPYESADLANALGFKTSNKKQSAAADDAMHDLIQQHRSSNTPPVATDSDEDSDVARFEPDPGVIMPDVKPLRVSPEKLPVWENDAVPITTRRRKYQEHLVTGGMSSFKAQMRAQKEIK